MLHNLRSKGLIFIISSPSGGGKSSLCRELLKADTQLKLSISVTTRAPRKSEIEGVHYYFKTEKQFISLIKQDLLLEYAVIYNEYYGTLKSNIESNLNNGYDMLFDIDWQGAQQIREQYKKSAVLIFILPPSLEVLRHRLELRKEDSPEVIDYRIGKTKAEIVHAKEYDYVIVNEIFATTLWQLQAILNAERSKTCRLDKLKNYL